MDKVQRLLPNRLKEIKPHAGCIPSCNPNRPPNICNGTLLGNIHLCPEQGPKPPRPTLKSVYHYGIIHCGRHSSRRGWGTHFCDACCEGVRKNYINNGFNKQNFTLNYINFDDSLPPFEYWTSRYSDPHCILYFPKQLSILPLFFS